MEGITRSAKVGTGLVRQSANGQWLPRTSQTSTMRWTPLAVVFPRTPYG